MTAATAWREQRIDTAATLDALDRRLRSTDPGVMMPETGRQLVDERAVALIEEWIARMDAEGHVPDSSLASFDEAIDTAAAKVRALANLQVFAEVPMGIGPGIDWTKHS